MRSDSGRGKVASNMKRKMWIWMDYTSEGDDNTKGAALTDINALFSSELQSHLTAYITVISLLLFFPDISYTVSPPLSCLMLVS